MLIIEDLISKMKVHFPRWMDIRRKIKTSYGGQVLYTVAEQVEEIQNAINEYKKDFFLDKYIGHEDEVLTYLYKYQIGNVDVESIKLSKPEYIITEDESEFHNNSDMAYFSEGSIYLKENIKEIEYFIDNYKSIGVPEKIHVWNIFDEFAAFIGIRRFQWESNRELLNRTLAFSNNRVNSTENGLVNAIINNIVNIDNSITAEDISIEKPTAENLNKYYDEFETILDHLANVNRDVYRTKRWDLDTWNFAIKSVDYIPHAWDVALQYYANGVGYEDDLKVEIVDSEMKTDADIYFYKKTLEYINAYIKNNNIKESVNLNLIKHKDELIPTNVKYRITATEAEKINADTIHLESFDYKIGNINCTIDDIFDKNKNDFNDIDIIDNSILNPEKKYVLRFKSKEELKEMSINKVTIYNSETEETKDLIIEKDGFENTVEGGVRCSLTRKYLAEKYHYSKIENAHKEIEGFVISNVELPTVLKSNIDACHNEEIYYDYSCDEIPVLFHNIEKVNCYVQNDTILSDTVSGEKYININLKANSFSCNVFGPHKLIYSIDGGMPKSIEHHSTDSKHFSLGHYEAPKQITVKIILNPINNMQCAISDIMHSKYEFEVTTEKGPIVTIAGQKRLPNFMDNTLIVNMKTYTGFSPILKYIYIGTKVQNIVYGDINISPSEHDRLIIDSTNCLVELETYEKVELPSGEDYRLEHVNIDYISSSSIRGKSSDSYIELNLNDFKFFKSVKADRCYFESISSGSMVKHILKIPAGVIVRDIDIIGEYEKLIFKETLANILRRKGYTSQFHTFFITKTNDNILIRENATGKLTFIKINKNDLIAYSTAKVKVNCNREDVQTIFIEQDENNTSNITNEYEGYFDYISFYPTGSKIYKAINESNVISSITTVPQIINTFDNGYLIYSDKTLYYTIESLNAEYDAMFTFNNRECNYSMDVSPIKLIKKDMDTLHFNMEKITINYEALLGNNIEIPESITVNEEKIETAKYIITNSDVEVLYLDKHNDSLHEKDYIFTEILEVSNLRCSKLKYCNIAEIEDIYIANTENSPIDSKLYKVLYAEGIILWDETISKNTKVFIKYNIRKPKYIKLSIDKLYEKVQFSTNAYELLNKTTLYEVNNNDNFNLAMYAEYAESDLISVKCSNIGFEASIDKSILSFNKTLKNNTVAVKTGYYYLDGDEYYLFADENYNDIEQLDNIYFFNVIKENKKLYFNQTTSNMVSNSSLKTNGNGIVFNLECDDKNINGISKINTVTTCDNFNYWKSVGMNMAIVKGFNGPGIKFTGVNSFEGYAYLDISKYIPADNKKYIVSFFMKGQGTAYLGEERKLYSAVNEFNKQSIIDAKIKALKSPIEDDIYELEFINTDTKKHYLVIKGDVTIDDIIVQDKDNYNVDLHIKNIDHLNLSIIENIYANFETRLYLDDVEGAMFDGTEVKDNFIANSSYIDWGFTRSKKLSTYEQFKKCELSKLDLIKHNDNCYIKSTKDPGVLITDAIYIGNVNVIKNLMFKINDVMFENMKNFKIKILTSSNVSTGFKEISMHLDNIGSINGDKLSSYIKLMVEMPPNKVINSIELFTEYLSDDINNPAELPVISGSYISKVLDAQYNTRFLVKKLGYELKETDMSDILFSVRASKENTENTVWTEWKDLKFFRNENNEYYLDSRIVFEDYRYFQFRTVLKGANASVRIKNLDLEVI